MIKNIWVGLFLAALIIIPMFYFISKEEFQKLSYYMVAIFTVSFLYRFVYALIKDSKKSKENKTEGLMKINNSNELYKIINEIHDMWFDIEQVKNSHIEGSITIGLTRNSLNLEEKKVEKTLRINNVIKIDINDTEKADY